MESVWATTRLDITPYLAVLALELEEMKMMDIMSNANE